MVESDESIPDNITPPIFVTPRVDLLRGSPLSTKREKAKRTPQFRRPAPKVAKTVPPMRSLYSAFETRHPKLITRSGTTVPLHSPMYSKETNRTYFEQCFKVISSIGKGSFGEVYSVRSMEDGRNYAVKVSIQFVRQNSASKYREVENHMRLPSHSNLVEFVKAWEEGGRLYIQQELCEKSLFQLCLAKHALPEPMIWDIMIDLLKAIDHLHTNFMIHDDIKPDNIFLTSKGVCKLGDFGLVINLKNKRDVASAEEGDSKYLAPEVLNGSPSFASDIFSLGVTILEAATDMDVPSNGESWHQIRNGQIPDRFFVGISYELRFLIEWMLSSNPSIRPTAKELLSQNGVQKRMFHRSVYVKAVELKNSVYDMIYVMFTWFMALLSVLLHPAITAICERRRSMYATTVSSQQHTPISTPEANRAFARCVTSATPFDYSDDENVSFQRHLMPPIPRWDMDAADDDEIPTSSSNSSTIDSFVTSSPVRPPPTPAVPASVVKAKVQESPRRPNGWSRGRTPHSARRLIQSTENHQGCGDHSPSTARQTNRAAFIQTKKYERMRAMEACIDSDDNDDLCDNGRRMDFIPQSCPPLLRSIRKANLPRASKLNFNLLDDDATQSNEDDDSMAAAPPKRKTPTRQLRSTTTALRDELIAEDSSADEF